MQASYFRCSVGHLLYAATLAAASTTLFGWLGLAIAMFVLMLWWQILSGTQREVCGQPSAQATTVQGMPCRTWEPNLSGKAKNTHQSELPCVDQTRLEAMSRSGVDNRPGLKTRGRGFSKQELIVVLLLIGLLAGLLMPAAKDTDPLRHAEISMKMVARALKQYRQQHGQFPAAVLRDHQGQALHSWRAQILPFLETEHLAAAYDLGQAWNSPCNAALSPFRPWHFRTYFEQHEMAESDTAMQLMFAGDSLVLVEHEDFVSHWLEPAWLEQTQPELLEHFQQTPTEGRGHWDRGFFTSRFRGRLIVSMSNTFHVHPSADLESLQAALQMEHNTTEPVVIGQPVRVVHWANLFHLLVFVGVALYPLRWLHRINAARGPQGRFARTR